MQGVYYQEAMGLKNYKWKPFLGGNGAQSCTGRSISPSPAAQYSAVNGNSRILASLPSSVQRLH